MPSVKRPIADGEPSRLGHDADRPGHPPAELRVDCIRSDEGLLQLEAEWRRLEEVLPSLPFITFDWAAAWWDHVRARKPWVTDRLHLVTFRRSDGELVGVAPLMITERPSRGPLRIRQLQFLGADPNLTEIRTLAAHPDHANEIHAALVEHLKAASEEWDFCSLTGVCESGTFAQTIDASFERVVWRYAVPDYDLVLGPTWDAFKGSLSRNIKESLRKCYNSLKRAGIDFRFVVVRDPAELPRAIDTFLALHHQRSTLTTTVHHDNVFATGPAVDFLRDVSARFAARDALRIFQIVVDGQVVATRIGFVLRDALYLYYSGYNPAYRSFSIMTTVVCEALQYATVQGFRTVNLSTGNDVSKTRWNPRETVYREAVVVASSSRARLAYKAYALARSTARSVSTHSFARMLGR